MCHRDEKFFKECRIYGNTSWIYRYTKSFKVGDVTLNSLWARRHGTKFNGAPYIIQSAGEAVYSDEGKSSDPSSDRILYEQCKDHP